MGIGVPEAGLYSYSLHEVDPYLKSIRCQPNPCNYDANENPVSNFAFSTNATCNRYAEGVKTPPKGAKVFTPSVGLYTLSSVDP